MPRILRLNGRYYRTIPMAKPGYEEEALQLDADGTAFASVHCWNVGCPENPLKDEYWVDMGFKQTHEEAHRIERDFIRPALDAARRARILVCHVQTESIAKKYPQNLVILEGETAVPISHSVKPAIVGYRESILERNHGKDYATMSPLNNLDFPKDLAPMMGEPVIYSTMQLDHVLRKRGIVNIIYSGFAADMCLLNAPGAMAPMSELGYRVLLMREGTLGIEMPDWGEDKIATRWATRFVETHYGDTIGFSDFISGCASISNESKR